MPTQQYPFVRFEHDGTADEYAHTYLPVRIINPENDLSSVEWGLLDTGADSCLFPAAVASQLGHDLRGQGVESTVSFGIEETGVPTFKHTFRIELLSLDQSPIWSSGDIEVDCAESNPPVLLGVRDFLGGFRITIDYPQETMTLRW